ncbi:MAG: hypothetical protein QOJ63_38 [Solirubrobacteraceae bacterium]|jgi:hypothetical protein|nr:hypothetical protein [Solirubrobacteraceae bacterium]
MNDAAKPSAEVPRGLFALEIAYLVILLGTFVLFKTSDGVRDALPSRLGPLPVEVPWFGALGGALISLTGMFEHRSSWDHSYKYWHYSRPLVGAIIGSLGALLIFVLSDTASAGAATTTVTAFDVIAFLVGYREESFRELIKRVTDLLLKPGEPAQTIRAGSLRKSALVVDHADPPAASDLKEPSPVPDSAQPPPGVVATAREEGTPGKSDAKQ